MINEEVSHEVAEKAVRLAVQMKDLSVNTFLKALQERERHQHVTRNKRGQQSVKQLIGQGQGVSSLPVSHEGRKEFQRIARKYGVDFAILKEKERDPPTYTVFFKAKDSDAVTKILQDYSAKQMKEQQEGKESIRKKIKEIKEKIVSMPRQRKEKNREKIR